MSFNLLDIELKILLLIILKVFFVLLLSIIITFAIYQLTYWKNRKVLHVKACPLIGINSAVYFGKTSFCEHVKNLYNYFPSARYFGSFDFNTPVLIIRDSELLRGICIKNHDDCPDHKSFVTPEMDPILGKNLFSLKGENWKEMRNKLTPSFTSSKMKILFNLVSECSDNFVKNFENSNFTEFEVNLQEVFRRYTGDVIATSAFGIKINSLVDSDNDFYKFGIDAIDFSKSSRIFKFILYRFFPNLMRFLGVRFLSSKANKYFNNLINETIEERERNGIVRNDMINLMLQAKEKDDKKVTNESIIGQAFIFFLGGFDTTSVLLCSLFHELSLNPEVQEKLISEIDQFHNENDEISYDSLGDLKYLDMVINETLRKYPPLPISDRVCNNPVQLPPARDGEKNIVIEPGTSILIPIFGIQNDPNNFKNPETFDPERFNDDNKKNIKPYTFIPFGIGPRQCIGNRFALMETKILIVRTLKKFTVRKSKKVKIPMVFNKKSFSIVPDVGYWAYFVKRKKDD